MLCVARRKGAWPVGGHDRTKAGGVPSAQCWALSFWLLLCDCSELSLPLTLPTGSFGAQTWPRGGGRAQGPEARSKRARATGTDMGSTAKKPRKCSVCHQPGHTRPFCPQNT